MNKRLHRVVFNAARGLRVVVQETARAVGKASGVTPLVMAAVLMAAWPVSAQIVGAPGVPPNLRPTVLVAPNGVPLVNIQTPSAAGVSRNLYHQFDVQPRGVILNNSRTDVQTQLGGWVQGNPYLATGSARVILNEITSGNPTQLRGAIEVGGQRAEVVVANPAGIAVDGATFINASRATLTTGTPQLNALGGLDGYVVRGGTVTFDGAGLDARSTDYTAILARAAQINAGLWANELKVVSGPSFSNAGGTLDIAGSFSANVDRFDNAGGTLRAASLQIASSGDLLNRDGQLESAGPASLNAVGVLDNTRGSIQSATDLSIRALHLNNGGSVRAGHDTTLHVGSTLVNDGGITAARHITISAGSVRSTGVLAGGIQSDGQLGSMGDLRVTSAGALQARGTNLAAGNATLQGASVDLSSSTTGAPNVALSATQGDVNTGGATITTPGTLSVTANTQGSQALVNQGGKLHAGQLNLNVSNLANTGGGEIVQTGNGAMTIATSGSIDNSGGRIATNAVDLTLDAAAGITNTGGRIEHAGTGTLRVAGHLSNQGGLLQSGAAMVLDIRGGAFDNRGGQTLAAGELRIDANAIDNTAGLIRSSATTVLHAASVTNAATLGPDRGIEGRNVVIGAGHLNNNTGAIRADADVTITSRAGVDNASGLISAGKTLAIVDPNAATPPAKTLGLVNTGGKLVANESLSIDAATFSADGQVASGRDLSIALTQDVVNHAELAANGNLRYTTTGNFTNHGKLLAGETLTIGGQNIDNATNAEMSADTTVITAAGTLTNRGLVDGHDTRIDAAEVRNLGTGRLYGDALSISAGTRPDPGSRYLVETDSRFASYALATVGASALD